jgi:hypothetical protein
MPTPAVVDVNRELKAFISRIDNEIVGLKRELARKDAEIAELRALIAEKDVCAVGGHNVIAALKEEIKNDIQKSSKDLNQRVEEAVVSQAKTFAEAAKGLKQTLQTTTALQRTMNKRNVVFVDVKEFKRKEVTPAAVRQQAEDIVRKLKTAAHQSNVPGLDEVKAVDARSFVSVRKRGDVDIRLHNILVTCDSEAAADALVKAARVMWKTEKDKARAEDKDITENEVLQRAAKSMPVFGVFHDLTKEDRDMKDLMVRQVTKWRKADPDSNAWVAVSGGVPHLLSRCSKERQGRVTEWLWSKDAEAFVERPDREKQSRPQQAQQEDGEGFTRVGRNKRQTRAAEAAAAGGGDGGNRGGAGGRHGTC